MAECSVKGSLAAFGLLMAALIVVPLVLESSPEIAARPEGAGSRVSSEQAIAACRSKAETWLPRYFKQDHDCPDCGVGVRFRGDGSSVDPWEGAAVIVRGRADLLDKEGRATTYGYSCNVSRTETVFLSAKKSGDALPSPPLDPGRASAT